MLAFGLRNAVKLKPLYKLPYASKIPFYGGFLAVGVVYETLK